MNSHDDPLAGAADTYNTGDSHVDYASQSVESRDKCSAGQTAAQAGKTAAAVGGLMGGLALLAPLAAAPFTGGASLAAYGPALTAYGLGAGFGAAGAVGGAGAIVARSALGKDCTAGGKLDTADPLKLAPVLRTEAVKQVSSMCGGRLNWNAEGRDPIALLVCLPCRVAFAFNDNGPTICTVLSNAASPFLVYTTSYSFTESRIASLCAVVVWETWVNQKAILSKLHNKQCI